MPYIAAYEPGFIEICDVYSGELQQVLPSNNLRVLNHGANLMHCVLDLTDCQKVFRIRKMDFEGN